MNLFDFEIEVEQVFETKRPKPAPTPTHTPKSEPVPAPTADLRSHMTKRLMQLSEELRAYSHLSDEQIKKISASEHDWVRCMRIQVEQLKKELKKDHHE